MGTSIATLDSKLLQIDNISSSLLPKSILPPIPNIASITIVSLGIFLSAFKLINSKFLAFLNACSHKGDFFASFITSKNLIRFFNLFRPIPMKYPSPPLLPGPHKIKKSEDE